MVVEWRNGSLVCNRQLGLAKTFDKRYASALLCICKISHDKVDPWGCGNQTNVEWNR